MKKNYEEHKRDHLKNDIKEKGSTLLIGIFIAAAIVLLIIFLIIFKINFMVGEQLRITVTPEYSEVQATSPGSIPFDVDVKLYNKFVCNAICNYTLTDMSYDILLENGTFNSKAYKSKVHSFNIPLEYYGSGTNMYLYRLECRNVPTTLCPASESLLVRKSLLTVKYSPSQEQLSAKEFVEKNFGLLSENIINASKYIEADGRIMDSSDLSFNVSGYNALKSERDTLLESIDGLISIWRNGDFISTKEYLVDIKLLNRTSNLLVNAQQFDSYLTASIQNHNALIIELTSLHVTLQEYQNLLSLNMFNIDASTRKSLISAVSDGNDLIDGFESQNYVYGSLNRDISELKNRLNSINNIVINSTNAELSRDLPSLYIYSNMLCMDSKNVSNGSVNFCNFNYAHTALNLTDSSEKLRNICNRAASISDSIIYAGNDSKETLLWQYKLLIDYESMTSKNSKNPILTYYSTYIRDSLKDLYNVSNPENLLLDLSNQSNQSTHFAFNRNNLILRDIRDINVLCHDTVSIPDLTPLKTKYYDVPSINMSDLTAISVASLPDMVSQCCIYGKCQSCDKRSDKNPLILLHGHSFNKDVHAYQSIETFNSFEQAFREDGLYIQTGLLVNNGNSSSGILGHFKVPIISKPTYYLETYNDLLGLTVSEAKSGNVDTYALRLKESIDYTMYITGSDKVDIVAHSMGGLVVRRYMQIFGTQHIGTVILIGTPNNGVSEKTYALCKIFGALNECEDMRTDGIFIKKLNDYANQPDIKNLYLVIGKGCDTDGLDGDGVVSVNNSLIKNFPENRVLYVDGKCSGTTTILHGDMLDAALHPEVYDFIREKLNQN